MLAAANVSLGTQAHRTRAFASEQRLWLLRLEKARESPSKRASAADAARNNEAAAARQIYCLTRRLP